MSKKFCVITVLSLVFGAGLFSVEGWADCIKGPLDVSVISSSSSKDDVPWRVLVVAIANRGREHVKEISLDLWSGQSDVVRHRVTSIPRGHVWVGRFRVERPSSVGYVTVRYRIRDGFFSEFKTVQISGKLSSPSTSPLPASFVGLLGVALGSLLTGYLATRREREQARRDRGQRLFEKYEAEYQRFVRNWGGVPQLVVLQESYRVLDEKAWIPVVIRAAYRRTMDILQDLRTSEEDKRAACRQLLEAIEKHRIQPWIS